MLGVVFGCVQPANLHSRRYRFNLSSVVIMEGSVYMCDGMRRNMRHQ